MVQDAPKEIEIARAWEMIAFQVHPDLLAFSNHTGDEPVDGLDLHLFNSLDPFFVGQHKHLVLTSFEHVEIKNRPQVFRA